MLFCLQSLNHRAPEKFKKRLKSNQSEPQTAGKTLSPAWVLYWMCRKLAIFGVPVGEALQNPSAVQWERGDPGLHKG